MNLKDIQDKILETIDLMIEERFKEYFKSNFYIESTIKRKNENDTYNLEYNNQILKNIKAREDLILKVGDIVLVCIPNNNYSNMFIDLKRP